MATANQIRLGVGDYIERHMMPRLDGKRQFLLGMAYGLAAGKMDELMQAVQGNEAARMLGIVQENGEIDIDALYNAAYAQMQAHGKLKLDIPMIGAFAFDADDLRELYNAIKGRDGA